MKAPNQQKRTAHHPCGSAAGLCAAIAALVTLTATVPGAAADLTVGDDLITTTVASRPTDKIEEKGIRAGNFFVRPSAIGYMTFDDNIFETSRDTQSDIRFELSPSLTVKSNLPRHVLDFSLDGRIVSYADHSEQDYENLQARLKSALHFDHAHTLSLSALSALDHVELGAITTPTAAAEPIPVFHNRVSAGVTRDAGLLYGTLSASFERWDYSDVQSEGGTVVDEDRRDLDSYSAQFFAGYRFSPGYELVGKFRTLRQIGFSEGGSDLDSTGYDALGGIRFETGPLLRWRLLAGYGYRNYDEVTRSDFGSSLFEAGLQWSPSRRMRFDGLIERAFVDTLDEDGEARVTTQVKGQVTYEIYHNLTGIAGLKFGFSDFTELDQQDKSWTANVGLNYALTEDWSVGVNYEHRFRDSTDDDFDATRNRFMVGAKLKF